MKHEFILNLVQITIITHYKMFLRLGTHIIGEDKEPSRMLESFVATPPTLIVIIIAIKMRKWVDTIYLKSMFMNKIISLE